MSEMIERVAIALYSRETKPALKQFPQFSSDSGKWDSLIGESGKQMWRGLARAAIEAMREPTEEMKDAGSLDPGSGGPDQGYETDVWQAMIDAALGKVDA